MARGALMHAAALIYPADANTAIIYSELYFPISTVALVMARSHADQPSLASDLPSRKTRAPVR